MKEASKDQRRGVVSFRMLAVLAAFCALPVVILAQSPGWWTTRHVVITSGTANDYGAVNQGQLKNMALGAYQELQSLPGGVGDTSGTGGTGTKLNGMIMSWGTFVSGTSGTFVEVSGTNTNDYAPVNIGQLKNVASLFYNRLIEVGYTDQYPWLSSTNAANDYVMANIGQMKYVFSFDLTYHSDPANPLPDWWQQYYLSGTGNAPTSPAPSGALDSNGNPMTLLEAYQNHVSPVDYYNAQAPVLMIVSGNNQTAASGAFTSAPLVVKVTSSGSGAAMGNAPVTFLMAQGGGQLASGTQGGITLSSSLAVRTDSNGLARAWFQGGIPIGTSTITASAGTASPVSLNEKVSDPNLLLEYKFNDGLLNPNATTAADSSGNNNTGTLENGPQWTSGIYGGALSFSGLWWEPQDVRCAAPTNLNLGQTSFAISVLFQTGFGYCRFVSDEGTSNDTGLPLGFFFGLNYEGQVEAGLAGSASYGNDLDFCTQQVFTDSQWHMATVVFDQTLLESRIYIDGTAQPLAPYGYYGGGSVNATDSTEYDFSTSTDLNATSNGPLLIGNDPNSYYPITGTIENIRIYQSSMAAAQTVDSDGNGLPDWWEYKYFGQIGQNPNALSPSGDGKTLLQDYQAGFDPRDYFHGLTPLLVVAGGDNQTGFPGAFAPAPLVVHITDQNNQPLSNAPVTFNVQEGGGNLATGTNTQSVLTGTLSLRTDANGNAQAYYQEPAGNPVRSTIGVTSGSATGAQFTSLNSTLAGEWKFDEGTGYVTVDSLIWGDNGTLTGGVVWTVSFDESGALQFDGQSGCVEIPDGSALQSGTGPMTVMAWVQLTSGAPLVSDTNAYDIISSGTTGGTGFELALGGGAAHGLVARIFNGGTTQQIVSATHQAPVVSDGNWHHVAFVRDVVGNANLYLDGASVMSQPQSGMGGSVNSAQPVRIGAGPGGYFNGAIDNATVRREALSGSAIAAAYNQDSDGNGLPDWWEHKYFGYVGVNPNAPAPNRGGLTILQAYQQGQNPLAMGAGSSFSSSTPQPGGGGAGPQTDQNHDDSAGTGLVPVNLTVAPQHNTLTGSNTVTTAELEWANPNQGTPSITVQRRDGTDSWKNIKTVTDTGVAYDQPLMASISYQYRLLFTYPGGQSFYTNICSYTVPLFSGMSVKLTPAYSRSKLGWREFTNPSTPPKYYLVDTQNGNNGGEITSTTSGGVDYTIYQTTSYSQQYYYRQTINPTEHNWYNEGNYTSYRLLDRGFNSDDLNLDDQIYNDDSSVYHWYVQTRGKNYLSSNTQGDISDRGSFNETELYSPDPWGNTGYTVKSGTNIDGNFGLTGAYQANNGFPIWLGNDFDLQNGSVNYSGDSNYSKLTTNSSDQISNPYNTSTNTIENSSPDASDHWLGTSTTDGNQLSITYPAWEGYWMITPWFGNLTSATQTQRNYSANISGSGDLEWNSLTEVLSQEYTTSAFIQDTLSDIPDYPDQFTDNWYGWGYYGDNYWGYYNYNYFYYGWWIAGRTLNGTEDSLSISKGRYKLKANDSAPGTTVKFYDIFVPVASGTDVPPAPYVVGTHTFTGGPNVNETSAEGYEIDPSLQPNAIASGCQNGNYYITPGVQIAAQGQLADTTAPGGVDPGAPLDGTEKADGSAVLQSGGSSASFGFTNVHVAGATYTITISGNGFIVTDNYWNEAISNNYEITQEDLDGGNDGNSFSVAVDQNVNVANGQTVTVTVTVTDSKGNSLGTDSVTYTNSKSLKTSFTIPFEEASGSRYRKIGLNGRPMPDEKPQHTAESDEEKEESYIDALTLGLHHSTTDVYVPVAGSDLTITARRDTASENWNMAGGLRPHERFDRPFGAGWSSNICANLEYVNNGLENTHYYYVTDQNGSSHRFILTADGHYVPLPSDQRENGDYLTKFDGGTFTDRYGTKITFNWQNPITQTISVNRAAQIGSETHVHYGAAHVADRFGNTLDYTYPPGSTTLIPSTISQHGHPDQTLYIRQDTSGHITQIWDPKGNAYQYHYSPMQYPDDPANPGGNAQFHEMVLDTVTAPDGALTQYTYDFALEQDLTPDDISNGNIVNKYHLDVKTITDPLNNTYAFTYQVDHTKFDYSTKTGYFIETGAPRNVVRVGLPNNLGATVLGNDSTVKLAFNNGVPSVAADSIRKTHVTDATTAATTTYTFGASPDSTCGNTEVFNIQGIFNDTPSWAVPKIVYYLNMQVDYGAGLGSETFTFDPTAGLALGAVKDLSGNTASYLYTDPYVNPYVPANTWAAVFNPPGFFGYYEDPTRQTDALGNSKTFHYGAYRIMDSVKDEAGRLKTYELDSLGRRLNEVVYAGSSSSTATVQETDFAYENTAFPGVVTRKTVKKLAGDPASSAANLVTQYVLEVDGRVAQEVVDPDGLHLTTGYLYDTNGNKISATDPKNHTTWFSYDSRNRLTSVTYFDGTQKQIYYDARGNKTRETDENGHNTVYAYDALNRVTTQTRNMTTTAASDLVTRFTYNAVNSKLSVIDPNGFADPAHVAQHTTQMQYDALQRLTQVTDANNGVTTFAYGANCGSGAFDTAGFKPTSTTDPANYTTTVVYDALYRATSRSIVYNQTGSVSTASTEYDNVGNATASVDPLNNRTETDYDALNRPVATRFGVTSPGQVNAAYGVTHMLYTSTGLKWRGMDERGIISEIDYDHAGRPVTSIADVGGLNITTQTAYDAAGNVTSTINPLGKEWDYTYDLRNRKIQEQAPLVPDAANNGNSSHPTKISTYDNVGNVVAVQDARAGVTNTAYDAANRAVQVQQPADVNGNRPGISTIYDCNGNVTQVTDPDGHVTVNAYDGLNRLTSTTDAAGIVVGYGYDAVGNRVSVTDGKGQVTAFTYDGLKRNLTITDAGHNATAFTYNALNKTMRTDANGNHANYAYDLRNRLTQVSYSDANGNAVNNAVNATRNYGYDLAGNLLSVGEPAKNGGADVAYTYDAVKRVISETSGGLTHSYVYDAAGNRLTTTYGGTGLIISSTYDALNRLSTMTENPAGTNRQTLYKYDLNGNIVQKVLPNGDAESVTFDALNRATVQSATTGAANGQTSLYTFSYAYDLAGNVLSVGETYPSGLNNRTVVNTYDAIYRLLSEADTVASATTTTSFTYDAANNRSTKIVASPVTSGTTNYNYNAVNQLTDYSDGVVTISGSYDGNGNRRYWTKSGNVDTYTYDFENRLVNLAKTISGTGITTGTYNYTYDYRTRRVLRDESAAGGVATQAVFSAGTSVQEYTLSGSLTPALVVEYIRGSDYGGGVGGVLYTLRSGSPSFTHENRRGDVVAKTDGFGSLTYQAAYEAFGKRTQEHGSTPDRQKANTKDEDPTGLLDEGFRYRDLDTGSFITKDPLGFVDGPNVYTYVRQNPWTNFDPQGLSLQDFTDGVKDVASAVISTIFFGGEDKGEHIARQQQLEKMPTSQRIGEELPPLPFVKSGYQAVDAYARGDSAGVDNFSQHLIGDGVTTLLTLGMGKMFEGGGDSTAPENSARNEIRPASQQPTGGNGVVLRDGEGATPDEIAASKGGPQGGSRNGQAQIKADQVEQQLTDQGFMKCWRCGATSKNPADFHLGHRNVPTSLDGNLDPSNVTLEGAACNLSAGNRGAPSLGMSCVERGGPGAPYGRIGDSASPSSFNPTPLTLTSTAASTDNK